MLLLCTSARLSINICACQFNIVALKLILSLGLCAGVERPSAPGDSDSFFGLIELTMTKTRKIMSLMATACGSAFAISNQYVITARHNLLNSDGHEK